MKRLITILASILIGSSVVAQSPQKMSYQAVIRNSSNVLVTSTVIGMQISILQGSTSGAVVYTETQTPTTNANGLVSFEIGGGTGFSTINWSAGPYFIKTETDPTGGSNYTISGTSQLLSVPYALHAETAETLTGTITETDPIFVSWDKTTGIIINSSQVIDFQTSITNNSSVVTNTAKNSYPSDDAAKLAAITGTNTGDQTLSGLGGLASNTTIDGATKTKITYDSKGLVTSGADATTVDIASSANRNYVTDAQLAIITGIPAAHVIGDSYGGGIVFYVYDGGLHGLIAATTDQSEGIQWYNGTYRNTGTTGDGIGAGAMNTAMIVATQIGDNQAGNFAAKVCADYSVYVDNVYYGDWYLPSQLELHYLYLQKNVVGGFTSNFYWSSSENSISYYAWGKEFDTGGLNGANKLFTYSVRAIRAF